ncbi:hypothetical protein C8R46DRAFT_1037107 [Mycena filopes]|nr:hypothetical protein C8R46DRAFT_1037107 [Mycena filopes]
MAHSTLIAVTAQIWTDSTWKQISSKFYSHDGNDLWHYSTPAGSADALAAISSNINLQFVATAARLKSPPYRWAETHTALTRTHDSVQGIEESGLFSALYRAVSTQRDTSKPDEMAWFDESLLELLFLWPPMLKLIPQSVVDFLRRRPSESTLPDDNFPTVGEALRSLDDPLFPADTAVEIPDEIRNKGEDEEFEENMIWRDFLWDKKSEAIFYTVTEYLQHCASSTPPYKATETLKRTISLFEFAPPRRIHPAHQARFAESISRIFETEQTSQLVDAIIDQKWWLIYADGHKNDKEMKMGLKGGFCLPWLQHPGARQMIKDTFAKYEGNSKARAEKIVEGLEFWHPEETSPGAVAQSDDTAAGEPAPAGPIASSSSGGRSSEEGSEETAKYPMSLFW